MNLSHNDLSSLRALEALWMIQTFVKLDLRHNMVIRLWFCSVTHVCSLQTMRK